jgi:transposase InsO family protein
VLLVEPAPRLCADGGRLPRGIVRCKKDELVKAVVDCHVRDLRAIGQFVSLAFGQPARAAGIAQSMGSKGDCFDNAVAESFFATLKKELIHRRSWPTTSAIAGVSGHVARRCARCSRSSMGAARVEPRVGECRFRRGCKSTAFASRGVLR